jgi:hypothetical protein
MFENRIMRRISVHEREEVTGNRAEFLNEELCNLYSSASIMRMTRLRKMK